MTPAEARRIVAAAVEREADRLRSQARDVETAALLAYAARRAGEAATLALVLSEDRPRADARASGPTPHAEAAPGAPSPSP
ncbi:hypothetical protein ACTZWW_03160 [Salinarimonas sp. NSM]|uniref:hypothetical protein n=1 Tax=Salinarimonas sp. NSM TaxID=3458003 RepID=UPI0040366040